mmetsp:Transcript_593/g.1374  ORF Transcript_593/g.1374 Transcript_593/m.1374 type:complete len:243 (-) Transcript_593:625-1353(-)
MTEMYSLMKDQGHLRLFGSITRENMPASGSHTVRPSMLETITSLSMNSLTPRPSNTLLYAGIGVATVESIASEFLGLDLNALFFASFGVALCDQLFLNGALSETAVKILSPETQSKITRHEAGHFLCSYILGCPVEGYVLSAWGALEDPRFRGRGVSAGTSVSRAGGEIHEWQFCAGVLPHLLAFLAHESIRWLVFFFSFFFSFFFGRRAFVLLFSSLTQICRARSKTQRSRDRPSTGIPSS